MNQRKEKKWLIAKLLKDMFEPEWFWNFHTHGCYGSKDFLYDLRGMSLDELKALRKYQEERLDADLFYEHIWTSEGPITYRKLA